MDQYLIDANSLRKIIIADMLRSLNLPWQNLTKRFVLPLTWPAAYRFSKLAATFDNLVERYDSLCDAMSQILPRFIDDIQIFGADLIPQKGPLMILSNHPGAFDEFVIASSLPRNDLSIVADGFPFLRNLPATSRYLIYVNKDLSVRMNGLREIIRRLQNGLSLLIFPSGGIDPDPKFLQGASDAIDNWSPSIELILKKVPQTQVLISIVSGVLSPSAFNHPFPRLFKDPQKRQKVAEGLQIMHQMFFPSSYALVPKITYDKPFSISDVVQKFEQNILGSVIQSAKNLLEKHNALNLEN